MSGWNDKIDWPATEALGTWAGAAATAIAVFIAASFSDWRARAEAIKTRKSRYAALASIYAEAESLLNELRDAASPSERGIVASPPSRGKFDDLLSTLTSVPLLELGNTNSLADLFAVRAALNGARDIRDVYNTPDWRDESVSSWCTVWMDMASRASAAGWRASVRGVWPHKNRAGEWVFPPDSQPRHERH